MITIINYGLGNISAFKNVYKRLNVPVKIASSKDELADAKKIILPGVGAFDHAMRLLQESGMRELLDDLVMKQNVPVLGICVGMQMLAKSSEEGNLPGLCWIDGLVKKFDPAKISHQTKFPHMGWNTITPDRENTLMTGFTDESKFYFLHSFYFACNQPENSIATTEYGIRFDSAVNKDNIFGVQFHPEKSHNNGIELLHNFAKL